MSADARLLQVDLLGLGLLGPAMNDVASAFAALRDPAAWTPAPTVVPPPARLPPAERRRAGIIVKLGLTVADQAVVQSGLDAASLPTVFAAASGDGANLHAMCETLATPERLVSPTRFTNSVHNASAGYWHIAVASRAPSTSLAAHDGSFGAGLLEAASQCVATGRPVLFVATDAPYPEPLNAARPVLDAFGVAMVLAPAGAFAAPRAALSIALAPGAASGLPDPRLEALRAGVPAARVLPLVACLAAGTDGGCRLQYLDDLSLRVDVRAIAS